MLAAGPAVKVIADDVTEVRPVEANPAVAADRALRDKSVKSRRRWRRCDASRCRGVLHLWASGRR